MMSIRMFLNALNWFVMQSVMFVAFPNPALREEKGKGEGLKITHKVNRMNTFR